MRGICPECEQISELENVHRDLDVVVRGEPVRVSAELCHCLACDEEFKDLNSNIDYLDVAFREYRNRHNMLMPEEIKELREDFGLTQNELTRLLGWGGATLSRYENGALQSDANDRMLRLLLEPGNLLRLIEETPSALSGDKRAELIRTLRQREDKACSPSNMFERWFGNQASDEFTGNKSFNQRKLFDLILFFCRGDGVFKTKLNKLLFYADFAHFKKYEVSITGVRYVRLSYGPVPENFGLFYDLLFKLGEINIEEVIFSADVAGERFTTVQEPELARFNDDELATITYVKEHFKNASSKEIVELSHRERGYIETQDKGYISYCYSGDLQLA